MKGSDPDRGATASVAPVGCARRGLLAAALLALALAGCASSPYGQVHDRWTQREDAYSGWQASTLVRATLKSEAFRRAYVAEYARVFALNAEQQATLLDAELEEQAESWVVVVALYTSEAAANDLDPAHGHWSVRLEGPDGRWNLPAAVRELPRKSPTWRHFFPAFEVHFRLHELRFSRRTPEGLPLAAPGEPLSLVIAGPPAQLRLRWTAP